MSSWSIEYFIVAVVVITCLLASVVIGATLSAIIFGIEKWRGINVHDNDVNIRHDIPQDKVAEQINKKVQELQDRLVSDIKEATELYQRYQKDSEKGKARWVTDPSRPETREKWLRGHYHDRVKEQRVYFSTVRVIERPSKYNPKPFILVYGDVDDSTVSEGTGGFETYEQARDWFLNSGR